MKTNNTSKRFLFAALALTALAAGGSAAAQGFSFDSPSALPPLPETPQAATTAVRADTLDQAAAAALQAMAGQPGSDLGPVNGGNLGLSAYRLGPDAANRAARLAKQAFPGIAPGNAAYSAAGPQLLLVITSDDEPYVYLFNQDPATGRLAALASFNIVDAVEAFYADPQLAALADGYEDWDWAGALDGLAGKGIGAPVPLGPGSAPAWWWSAGRTREAARHPAAALVGGYRLADKVAGSCYEELEIVAEDFANAPLGSNIGIYGLPRGQGLIIEQVLEINAGLRYDRCENPMVILPFQSGFLGYRPRQAEFDGANLVYRTGGLEKFKPGRMTKGDILRAGPRYGLLEISQGTFEGGQESFTDVCRYARVR